MSVMTARSERAPIPYGPLPRHNNIVVPNYRASPPYAASTPYQTVPYRISPVSSTSNDYYHSITPAVHSRAPPRYRNPISKNRPTKPSPSGPFFKRVPPKIYDCILNQLQDLHMDPSQFSCLTCFQRDLHSLALTSRAWEKAVRNRL
jgi:hypothetical protein